MDEAYELATEALALAERLPQGDVSDELVTVLTILLDVIVYMQNCRSNARPVTPGPG